MPNITREERERRRLAAEAAAQAGSEPETVIIENDQAPPKGARLESRHWPGLHYPASDPEPAQNPILGTQTPEWQAWFQRQGGAK